MTLFKVEFKENAKRSKKKVGQAWPPHWEKRTSLGEVEDAMDAIALAQINAPDDDGIGPCWLFEVYDGEKLVAEVVTYGSGGAGYRHIQKKECA